MKEYKLCPVCGGISREGAYPRLMHGLCTCPQKKATPVKYAELDDRGDARVSYGEAWQAYRVIRADRKLVRTVHISNVDDGVLLDAKQALSLLAWLKQEEAELQRLAKEQEP